MRLNKYIAAGTTLSRRSADEAIYRNRVLVNGLRPSSGQDIGDHDIVTLDGSAITPAVNTITILLNKPAGYVCSRDGQGSKTVYDLLPPKLHVTKPVGRLDKQSSGLLLLTTDGDLAQQLTHPKYQKRKLYEVTLDKPLQPLHRQMIHQYGIRLEDGISRFNLSRLHDDDYAWVAELHEGRNRQIRRTFESLGYAVTRLHRTVFGEYTLGSVKLGEYKQLD